jgi:phosphoglucosamine mutase
MKNQLKLFGTDGIRSRFGSGPLSTQSLIAIANAIALWAREQSVEPIALIIRDTRASGKIINTILCSILSQHAVQVIDAGILPTPAAAMLINAYKATFAIIITASHNPAHDNGIKILTASGEKISHADEQRISELVHINKYPASLTSHAKYITHYHQAQSDYIAHIKQLYQSCNLQNVRIVIDCAHGAFSSIAYNILTFCGANVTVINNYPTGSNINYQCGAAQEDFFKQALAQYDFDYAFAFDGDGDRLIGIDRNGGIIDGDDFLWILANYPAYRSQRAIVGTIMTNEGLAIALQSQNRELIRVAVGDKYISRELINKALLLGGESSGHIIMRDKNSISDGLITLITFLDCMQSNTTLPRYAKYIQKQSRIACTLITVDIENQLQKIARELNDLWTDARIIIRPSGTEPVIRVMIEHADKDAAESYLQQALIRLHKIL